MSFNAFFADYVSGYVRQSPQDIAGFFHFPVVVCDQRVASIIRDTGDLGVYLAPFLERLAADGCSAAETEIKECRLFGDGQAICLVAYRLYDTAGTLFLDFDYLYHLMDLDGDWRIAFASLTTVR
ncbi:MAG: hypothetical protein ABFS30_05120 [Pseudomonadota bacterium]